MNKNVSTSKDFNVNEAEEVRTTTIEIVKVSPNLEMIKDNTGIIYDSSALHFFVSKGGNVRHALRDAMGVLKTEKDKTHAVLKYKEFEVSFGRDEKFVDILDYIYNVDDFMKNQTLSSNSNFSR